MKDLIIKIFYMKFFILLNRITYYMKANQKSFKTLFKNVSFMKNKKKLKKKLYKMHQINIYVKLLINCQRIQY